MKIEQYEKAREIKNRKDDLQDQLDRANQETNRLIGASVTPDLEKSIRGLIIMDLKSQIKELDEQFEGI
jgi:tetrahydromethanopterin S-methyltransferase subunit G